MNFEKSSTVLLFRFRGANISAFFIFAKLLSDFYDFFSIFVELFF